MGELGEERWALISERGCEASGVIYAEAAALMRQLAAGKVHGLCIVTGDAARYLPRVKSPASTASPQAASAPQQDVSSK